MRYDEPTLIMLAEMMITTELKQLAKHFPMQQANVMRRGEHGASRIHQCESKRRLLALCDGMHEQWCVGALTQSVRQIMYRHVSSTTTTSVTVLSLCSCCIFLHRSISNVSPASISPYSNNTIISVITVLLPVNWRHRTRVRVFSYAHMTLTLTSQLILDLDLNILRMYLRAKSS